jgi:hypothetical protein
MIRVQAARGLEKNTMADAPEAPVTATEAEEGRAPLGRRLFVLRLAALGGATSATAGCVAPQPQVIYAPPRAPAYAPGRVAISDADPSDPPGGGRGGHRGSGVSDNDPSDAPGFGRGGRRVAGISDNDPSDPPGGGRGYRATGASDNDPSDAPGRGRGGNYRPAGISDNDPSDAPGRGRGGAYRAGASDSDPYDAPGRGRRGW